MFESKFLAYILYVTLVEMREIAYKANDSRSYYLTDMLHNVPFSLLDENAAKEEYLRILEAVQAMNVQGWLDARMDEFKKRFPEFKKPSE